MIDITNISDMTEEQLRNLLQSAADQVQSLEAERDSFKEKAEKYVIQRHLSHGAERQDLKKIYLYS